MRSARRLILSLLGMIVLGVLGINLILAACDTPFVKTKLERAILESTQQPLRIHGDLSLSLTWPLALAIRLGRSEIPGPRMGEKWLGWDNARATIQILPLFARQPRIEIDLVEIDGLEIGMVRQQNGRIDMAHLSSDMPPSPQRELPPIHIGRLSLMQGKGWLHDQATGHKWTFHSLQLESGRLANEANGQGQLSVTLQPDSTGQDKPASLLNLSVSADYAMSTSIGHSIIRNLAIHLDHQSTQNPRNVTTQMHIDHLDMTRHALKANRILLKIDVPIPDQASIARVTGQLSTSAHVDLNAQSIDFHDMAADVNLVTPQQMRLSPGNINGQAHIDLAKQAASIRMAGHSDSSSWHADLSIGHVTSWSLHGNLDIDRLDADRLLSLSTHRNDQQRKFDLHMMDNMLIQAHIQIGELILSRAKIRDAQLTVSKSPGKPFTVSSGPAE